MTRSALWTKHRPIAIAIAADYRVPGLEAEDVRQEALVALWEATGAYDDGRGAFPSFARRVVRRHLIDLLRAATTRGRTPIGVPVDLDQIPALERLTLAPLLELHSTLTTAERHAIRDHLNGVPATVSKAHNNALTRARRKLAS